MGVDNMHVSEIFRQCEEQGVVLKVSGDKLDISFDEMPSEDLISQLKENKKAIILAIAEHQHNSSLATKKNIIKPVARDQEHYLLSRAQSRL